MTGKQEYNGLWVYLETSGGAAKQVGLELLAPGRELADTLGQPLTAVVVGRQVEEAIHQAATHRADRVLVVQGKEYEPYSTEGYTAALYELVRRYHPLVLLIGATHQGRDLAPRLACRLRTGLTADCTALAADAETGNMAWTRPAFGGNLMATILCPDSRPQIGTVRPGVFRPNPGPGTNPQVIHTEIRVDMASIRTALIEHAAEATEERVRLEEAEIIVSGGRGLGKPENFAVVRRLAKTLGGTVGASRAAVDAGWIPHAHQVGQTGKAVGPKIYFACGISGAVQHLAGMFGSDTIIAINKDPAAPIFAHADYGIVGDCLEVIPALVKALEKGRGGNAP